MLLVDDYLEDEVLEPLGGHEEVALLPPLLPPGVLHPPPGYRPVLLDVATSDHLNSNQINTVHLNKRLTGLHRSVGLGMHYAL